MRYIELLGRMLYVAIFLVSAPRLFSGGMIAYAASFGTWAAYLSVPFAGALALLGSLSVLFGVKARWGACLLVVFLIPVTFIMHRFWGLNDPQTVMTQQIQFMKNLGLLGGALLIAYHGAGPIRIAE